MAKLGRLSSRGAGSVGHWIDAGRSSVVLVLGLALALPTVNVVPFDGLPLDRPAEIAALATLLPFLFSRSLRGTLGDLLRRYTRWGPRLALAVAGIAIAIKIVLLLGGADNGFVACYSSTWRPPPDRCEESYSNVFHRHDGATRVDRQIDFGPSQDRASALVRSYSTLTYERGAAATDWGLSFSNDLRFNQPRQSGISLHELMPFAVTWRGTAKIPADGLLRIRYRGGGTFEIGSIRLGLPPSQSPRTILVRVPGGDQPLRGKFEFPERASEAELRLLSRDGVPIAAADATAPERIAATTAALILAVAFLGLIAVALGSLRGDLLLLGLVALAALAVAAFSSPNQQFGFQYLAALLAPIMLLRLWRRPILWAFFALLLVEGGAMLNSVPDLHAVLYRASGTDFLTYESFARRIVLDQALDGGEAVFFYQPGSRYATGLMHLLFGDGDVLITWWWMVVVNLPFLALLAWNRHRAGSSLAVLAGAATGFLVLAVLNSKTIISLVAMGTSEVPTWALLPCAVAAPQMQPKRAVAWAGSSVAASLMYLVRTNQALGTATILAAIAVGLWRRRLLWGIASLVAVVLLAPTIHNLVFGGELVLTTTSAALTQEVQVGQLINVFSDNALGGLIRGHLSAILYLPPTDGLTHQSLAWLLWGLLALWLTAVGVGLARLRSRTATLKEWLLLLLPIAYLFPHLLYQVEVYFPRHIIVGYLAMGASAIGVLTSVAAGGTWRVPRPVIVAAGSAAGWGRRMPGGVLAGLSGVAAATSKAGSETAMAVSRTWRGNATAGRLGALRTPFPLSGVAFPAIAFLAPFSATRIADSLTTGRAAAVALAAALALDLARARPQNLRFPKATMLAGGAYIGLFCWILISASAWGCNCDGKLGGFAEFAFVGLLVLAVVTFAPQLRERIVLAMLCGLGLAAVLALLGVGAINSGTVDLTQTGGRLSGTYGNANELGFAIAVAMPIAGAYLLGSRGRIRWLFAGAFLVLAVTLALTYSRGGILAAALGLVAVAFWSVRGSRRRMVLVLGALAAAALAAAALYSLFERERRDASFVSVPTALRQLDQHDLSGWDSRARGPIPAGPSQLRNQPDGIAVHGERGGEGTSYRWGEAVPGGNYELRFRARTTGAERLPFAYAMGDGVRGGGPERRTLLGPRWRLFDLAWHPRKRAPHATLYLWQGSSSSFVLGDVSVVAQLESGETETISVPSKLRGSAYDALMAAADNEEDRYVRSRLDAADLALNALISNPLRGIGWSTFPDYSDARLDYGQLAAHNQYLAIGAELGIVGLILLATLIAAVALGVRRAGPGRAEAAAIGALAAAAAGLIFVEAFPVPQLSISIAVAAAIICSGRRAPDR